MFETLIAVAVMLLSIGHLLTVRQQHLQSKRIDALWVASKIPNRISHD